MGETICLLFSNLSMRTSQKDGFTLDELTLIKRIQQSGEHEAAEKLVRHYYDEIYRYVNRQMSGSDIALDLTQEIFISLLRTISHFDKKKGAFRPWLYRIATNKVIDWYRSRDYQERVKTFSLDRFEPVAGEDFTQQIVESAALNVVLATINQQLIDEQRIFRLHVFGEYTFGEIAEITGLPEGTIKSKYYRLKKRLEGAINAND